MAEAFNVHFTNIAKMLARDIPVGEVGAESFLSPSDNSFSLKTPSACGLCSPHVEKKNR